MSSYIESTRTALAERNTKVGEAVALLRKIISDHFYFDDGSMGSPMSIEQTDWDSETVAILGLYAANRKEIPQNDIVHLKYREAQTEAVCFATLQTADLYGGSLATAAIIETSPPNVRGYDGAPIPTAQIDDVIADLNQYAAALTRQ